jgi:hypothetical protein
MKKPSKKKLLVGNWEGPYLFINYVDEKENVEHDEGVSKCIIRSKE